MKAVVMAAATIAGIVGLGGCSTTATNPEAVVSAMTMECGQLDIGLTPQEDGLLLRVGEEAYLLEQTASASGARYALPVDPSTWLWSKGDRAQLESGGRRWPECVVAGGLTEPFVARGNEPFWQLTVEGGKLTLDPMEGPKVVADAEVIAATATGRTVVGKHTAQSVQVAVARQLCRDSMSGLPYPYQARLSANGETMSGCGGDPARLLQGVEWLVETIDGEEVLQGPRVSINFLQEGRVAGKASCNNFMGGYQLSGEGLSFSQTATTMMACAPEVMGQEDRFLNVLAGVVQFDFDTSGALVLTTTDGRTLTAQSHQTLGR